MSPSEEEKKKQQGLQTPEAAQRPADLNQSSAGDNTANRAEAKTKAQTQQKRNPRGFENIVLADDVSIEGLDRDKVMQAWQGDSFGWMDLERYNKMEGSGGNTTQSDTGGTTAQVGESAQPTQKAEALKDDYVKRTTSKDFSPEQQSNFSNYDSGRYLANQMEEDYSFSQRKSKDFASNAIKSAEQDTRSGTMVKGLNDAINKKTDYYRNRTDMQTLGLFGDIWNMKAFDWKAPQKPEEITTSYNSKDKDEDE